MPNKRLPTAHRLYGLSWHHGDFLDGLQLTGWPTIFDLYGDHGLIVFVYPFVRCRQDLVRFTAWPQR